MKKLWKHLSWPILKSLIVRYIKAGVFPYCETLIAIFTMKTFQACIAWGQIRGREDYMDNTLLRIENKAKDTVKLISLLRNNGVDVAEVEEAIQLVMQKYI